MLNNIGWPEILIILAVILVFFGARFIPKMGRNLGESSRELKEATKEFKEVITEKEGE